MTRRVNPLPLPLAALLWVTFAGCVLEGPYLGPGADLPEGGEVFLARIQSNLGEGVTHEAQLHAYRYTSAEEGGTLPAPGSCTSLRDGTVWPTHLIPAEAEYTDWGESIRLRSEEAGLDLRVPKRTPESGGPGIRGNRPNPRRLHPLLYGGPTWQVENLAPADLMSGAVYTVELRGETVLLLFPPENAPPLGIGTGAEPVAVPAAGDWEVSWPIAGRENHELVAGAQHYAFLAFAEETEEGVEARLTCLAEEDGGILVPRRFLDELPDTGLIQHGRMTHYMDDVGGRRLDLVALDAAVGTYEKELGPDGT